MRQGCLRRTFISEEIRKRLERVTQYLQETNFDTLKDGVYPIQGQEIFAMVQSFEIESFLMASFETHRHYIDVQYVLSGKLELAVTDFEKLDLNKSYDEKNDIAFYDDIDDYSMVRLYPGEAVVLFPEDAHRMICNPREGNIEYIRKCVIKVLV